MTINKYLLEDIEYSEHPSSFEVADGYSVLILRLPEFKDTSLTVTSYAFVIEDRSVLIYNRDKKELQHLGDITQLIDFLDEKMEKLIKDIQKYHIECEALEEDLYDDNLKSDFMHKWHTYKKEISLIHRLTFHAHIAYELFVNYQRKKEKEIDHSYTDLLEHINRVEQLSKAAMEKLENLYNFYRVKVDEKMNKNMYILTIISGIFLPLTLITGFFGMNTGGLPYTDIPNGTLKVVILSVAIEIAFLVPLFLFNKNRK